VIRDMTPALDDLRPTLVNLAELSPDLTRLYDNLDPLITISKKSLPATTEILTDLRPMLGELGPFLSEVNPILGWLGEHQHTLTDMFANLGGATGAKGIATTDPAGTGHYLRQFGPAGAETVAVHVNRLGGNRGNAYINPLELVNPKIHEKGVIPAYDCVNAGGEKEVTDGAQASAACYEQNPFAWDGATRKFPHLERRDYSK
jgi:hypothetical protein